MNDHEFRVIGPPGTGKTTYLSRQVERAVEAGRRVLITSMTRAAAVEIGSRVTSGWGFSDDQVGTLHSHCYRALNHPKLISKQEHVDDWNAAVRASEPNWELSLDVFGSGKGGEDGVRRSAPGDKLYSLAQVLRAQMRPVEDWPISVGGFWRRFDAWKRLNGLMDFSDLIEVCWRDKVAAPFDPDVIFVDEAQDHDRLELSLVRQWSAAADRVIIVGDPDQNLYEWRGADPGAFYATEIPAANSRVLSQSYRVPRAVHAKAQEIIRNCEDRVEVEYLPRDEEGACVEYDQRFRAPHQLCEDAAEIAASGRSVMILASCEYMLSGTLAYLRRAGIPFGNPYAPGRGNLNPLGERNGITTPQRLRAFLVAFPAHNHSPRRWTWEEFAWWTEPLSVEGLVSRGGKKKIDDLAKLRGTSPVDGEGLRAVLAEGGQEELRKATADPVAWYRSRLNKSRSGVFEFPLSVVERLGAAGLETKPNICVGTIHSVKGGEADVVVMFPDLSPQGAETLDRNPDSVWRMFYVGATRAKQELRLCRSSGSMAVRW